MNLRDSIILTDEEITEAFGWGVKLDDLRFTKRPLSTFRVARARYIEPGLLVRDEQHALEFIGAQAEDWEPYRDLTVVDFGRVRGVRLVLFSADDLHELT